MKDSEKSRSESEKQSNYQLKSDAVEELANADTSETPQYSAEELGKYRSKKGIHIPEPVKILFIKAWFAGAVCYFILWGLGGTYVSNTVDMLFILGMVLGMVTDLLTNNVIRFLEAEKGANDKWLLITKRGIIGFFANLFFSMIVVLGVFIVYDLINRFVVTITSDPDNLFLGVEPVLYGLFCMGFDMLFVGIKRLCQSIWNDAKESARASSRDPEDGA